MPHIGAYSTSFMLFARTTARSAFSSWEGWALKARTMKSTDLCDSFPRGSMLEESVAVSICTNVTSLKSTSTENGWKSRMTP
eukprot:CAMPEP_0197689450 /NCGR_PEP_ID=MMETSP1338-20131121/106857_1 /TAXON_ID=43686 ORGANISM="Pelagodinium beii, Strain RCC1491" /NCGR_SAMPLE_ID=MMETSP1338 /ASSEMBLY_ACC=CAM_ASM_000754 /LENGTH=81 /DNA_ID=CAMNT_0043271783 /DNA_START=57 /DNA_END=302 /DNA_ORIENTATION=+